MTMEMIIEAGKERFESNYGTEAQRNYANILMNEGYETEAYLSLGLGQVREAEFVHALNWGGVDYLANVVGGSADSKIRSIWFDDLFIDD